MRNNAEYKIQGFSWRLETHHSGKALGRGTLPSMATLGISQQVPSESYLKYMHYLYLTFTVCLFPLNVSCLL